MKIRRLRRAGGGGTTFLSAMSRKRLSYSARGIEPSVAIWQAASSSTQVNPSSACTSCSGLIPAISYRPRCQGWRTVGTRKRYSSRRSKLASAGVILAAVYMLSVVQRVFFGPLSNPKNKHLRDMNVRETVAVAPLIALIFIIGLFPNLFLSRMGDGVSAVLERYKESREAYLELGTSDTAKLTDRRQRLTKARKEEITKSVSGFRPFVLS